MKKTIITITIAILISAFAQAGEFPGALDKATVQDSALSPMSVEQARKIKAARKTLLENDKIKALVALEKKSGASCNKPSFDRHEGELYIFTFSCISDYSGEGSWADLIEIDIEDAGWGYLLRQIKFDYAG
jgi:hypothetical protein